MAKQKEYDPCPIRTDDFRITNLLEADVLTTAPKGLMTESNNTGSYRKTVLSYSEVEGSYNGIYSFRWLGAAAAE